MVHSQMPQRDGQQVESKSKISLISSLSLFPISLPQMTHTHVLCHALVYVAIHIMLCVHCSPWSRDNFVAYAHSTRKLNCLPLLYIRVERRKWSEDMRLCTCTCVYTLCMHVRMQANIKETPDQNRHSVAGP